MVCVEIELEKVFPYGVPDKREFRVNGIAGTAAEIQRGFPRRAFCGPELHQIGLELIGAAVRHAESGIVKVQIEAQHGIWQFHQLGGLFHSSRLLGVGIGDNNRRVQILCAKPRSCDKEH